MRLNKKFLLVSLLSGPALLLGACSDSSNDSDNDGEGVFIGLPEGLSLNMINASNGGFYTYNTTTGILADQNAVAAASQDSAEQNTQITDTSAIGHFLVWADAEEDHGHEAKNEEEEDIHLESRFLLMRPSYQPGSPIDADQFAVLFDFHGEELAGHLADEYRDPEPGSQVAEELERLNAFVTAQSELEAEVAEALDSEGQTLCKAYIDPYLAAELAHTHEGEEGSSEEAAHEETLVHYALTDTGRMYFYEEHEGALESLQGFVKLDATSSIQDCARTSIARVSEEGVLVFIPETQTLYLVDAHDGADFHQHSTWSADLLMPAGARADLVAIVGAGEAHDHDHEE